MRTRRNALVATLSLAAHAALLTAWLNTGPDARFVEPPAMDVALIRPPPRPLPKPAPRPHASLRTSDAPAIAPPEAAPSAPPPLPPPKPRTLDLPHMTDQELLTRAGPRPDIARLHAEEARQPMFSRRLGHPPEEGWAMGGCKPMSEHSNRDAPPCKVGSSEDLASRALGDHDPARNGFAGEARYKDAMKAYRERPGTMNPDDYPSIKCAILHKC